MTYDAVLNKSNFITLPYYSQPDKAVVPPKFILNKPLDTSKTDKPEAKKDKMDAPKTDKSEEKKDKTDSVKADDTQKNFKVNPQEKVTPLETIKPDISEMPDVSFIPKKWSRDLILYENKKPAVLKTYHFHYKGQNFPGIVTDNQGKIYLYDRANSFHRPLKHLVRTGDDLSGYHAGFQEEQGKKNSHYFIDLGSLEVLQAALKSSAGGKYNVAINDDDSFMTNWMRATSPDDTEKYRYWNDNSVRLHSKAARNLYPLWGVLGASLVIVPTTLMTIALVNQGDLTPNDRNISPPSDATQKALIGTMPLLGGIGLGVLGATLHHNKTDKMAMMGNENLKILDGQYADTFVEKPRKE